MTLSLLVMGWAYPYPNFYQGVDNMAKLTPQEYVEKHARNLKNAAEDIRRGIDRVTVAPGVSAVAKQEKMQRKLNEAIDDGRWAQKTAAVDLASWKSDAKDKGVPRISQGVEKAKTKNTQMAARLLDALDEVAGSVAVMPDDTLDDSIARMEAQIRGMASKKGQI